MKISILWTVAVFFVFSLYSNAEIISVKTSNRSVIIKGDDISPVSVVNQNYPTEFNFKSHYSAPYRDSIPLSGFTFIIACPDNAELSHTFDYTLSKDLIQLSRPSLMPNMNSQNTSDLMPNMNSQKDSARMPNVIIQSIGSLRGVNILSVFIEPFLIRDDYSLQYIESFDFLLDFGTVIDNKPPVDIDDYSLYAAIDNISQLPYLISKKKISKINQTLLSETDWYDSSRTYAVLRTKYEGIAQASAQKIINADEYFMEKNTDFLHLYYRGEEIPLYIIKDDNGKLDGNDIILFYGRRPFGDSVWIDHYDLTADFYLTYDDSFPGMRYNPLQITSGGQKPEQLNFYHIYRQQKEYAMGDFYVNTYTEKNEGWVWAIMDEWRPAEFDAYFDISPDYSKPAPAKLNISFKSLEYTKFTINSHHVKIYLNNSYLTQQFFDGGEDYSLKLNIPKDMIFDGKNKITVEWQPTDDEKNTIAVSSMALQSDVTPFTSWGKSELSIPAHSSDFTLSIPGFGSQTVILIDSLNNQITETIANTQGDYIKLAAVSGDRPYISAVSANVNIADTNVRGCFVVLPDKKNSGKYLFFNANDPDLSPHLSTLQDGDLIIGIFNSDIVPSASIKSFFSSLGAQHTGSLRAGKAWVFAAIKGSNQITEEIDDSSVSLSHFLENPNGENYTAAFNLSKNSEYKIFAQGLSDIQIAEAETVNKTNLKLNEANVLVIAYKDFLIAAQSYIDHKKIYEPNKSFLLIDPDDVYKEFNYGQKSPHALKNYFKYAYQNWTESPLTHVVLIGDASYDPKQLLPGSNQLDFIPSYGFPVSDYWYSLLDGDDVIPEISLGRIPVKNAQEMFAYLNKLREYDSIPNNLWMKKFLFLAGGTSEFERSYFYEEMLYNAETIAESSLCADTAIIRQTFGDVGGDEEAGMIREAINNGAMVTSFLGHGSPTIFDMDGWGVEKLNNKGKYGLLMVMSCNVNAFAEPSLVARNEDYLLTPDKGFIGTIGSTSVSFVSIDLELFEEIIKTISNPEKDIRYFSSLLDYAKIRINRSGIEERLTALQFSYLGDPLAKLRISYNPDFYSSQRDVDVLSSEGESIITEQDSAVLVSADIFNQSFKIDDDVTVRLYHNYSLMKDTLDFIISGMCSKQNVQFILDMQDKPGLHSLELVIDPDTLFNDSNRSNNSVKLQIEVFTKGILALDPLPFWDVNADNPVFRFISLADPGNTDYILSLKSSDDPNSVDILRSVNEDISIKENFIEWTPKIELQPDSLFWIAAQTVNKSTSKVSPVLLIPFKAVNDFEKANVKFSVFGKQLEYKSSMNNLGIKYQNDSSQLFLNHTTYPFNAVSVNGNKDVVRYTEIVVNNVTYISTGHGRRGVNILVLDSRTLEPKFLKLFDTWGVEEDWKLDSASFRLVDFIRDSIDDSDYMILTTCDESFRLPILFNDLQARGSLDTLKSELLRFGAQKLDSLNWSVSYALIAGRNPLNTVFLEDFNTTGDTARIEGNFDVYPSSGSWKSDLIGPATEWHSLRFNGSLTDTNAFYTELYAISKDGTENLVLNGKNTEYLLSALPANAYPYIRAVITLLDNPLKEKTYFSSLEADFAPTPEYAVIGSSIDIKYPLLQRGEDNIVSYSFENISKRADGVNVPAKLTVWSEYGTMEVIDALVPLLKKDESENLEFLLVTDNYELNNQMALSVNAVKSENEIYYFNNNASASFQLYEDTLKPEIRVFIDNRPVQSGDYIPAKPNFRIELFDNSPLSIDNPRNLQARFNGFYAEAKNFSNIEYISYGKSIPLKYALYFSADTLIYENNTLVVMAEDASGNSDTLRFNLFFSLNGTTENIHNYPNPLNTFTTFSFNYIAPENQGKAIITIYNNLGQKIRTLNKELFIGENELFWDARDDNSISLPSGVYHYIITVDADFWVEPKFGKLLINN